MYIKIQLQLNTIFLNKEKFNRRVYFYIDFKFEILKL
jgi:hypothetical protein